MLTAIVAASENNVIGKNGALLWHLLDDFSHFKKLTTGHTIIMGRKTFESLPKVLPNRTHLVISRNKNYKKEGIRVVNSLEKALEASKTDSQPFIIGGGQIYKQSMPFLRKIELTRVHTKIDGDSFFPEIEKSIWQLDNSLYHPKDKKHTLDFTFETYSRI